MAKDRTMVVSDVLQAALRAGDGRAEKQLLDDVHFVGLKKTGPMRYAVVTGTLGSPIVDNVSQPLEYAAEAAKLAWHKLLDVVP